MFLVTITPKPIQVLVDTLNADLAEEMARRHLDSILRIGTDRIAQMPDNSTPFSNIDKSANALNELFYVDKSDAKTEKSNTPTFGGIFKVI